jgi:hypothetical protein
LIENYTNQSNEMVEDYLKANVKNVRTLVDNFETAIKNAFEITNNESPFQKLAKLDIISEEIKRLNETLASYTKKEEDLINVVSNISNDVKSIRSETIFSDYVDNDVEG